MSAALLLNFTRKLLPNHAHLKTIRIAAALGRLARRIQLSNFVSSDSLRKE
jgi:hypothetical protein